MYNKNPKDYEQRKTSILYFFLSAGQVTDMNSSQYVNYKRLTYKTEYDKKALQSQKSQTRIKCFLNINKFITEVTIIAYFKTTK